MSIQPEEFLAQSPSAFLNQPSFLETGPQVAPQPVEDTHPDYLKIGVGIAAALVVLRLLMKHEFTKEDLLTDKEIAEAAARIYKRVIPAWLQAAVPAVLQAYRLGATEQLTYEEMTRLATSYAAELGDYVHSTSTTALLDGFNAQVNSGWSANLAWQRSREAYGLDGQQMRSYVQGLAKMDKTDYVTDPIPAASRMFVDRAFLYRADRLGTTEAYKASRVGKNMVWMIMEGTGQLPPGTMKKWVTAEDELVCGVCGPLHEVTIPLNERFETIGGERFYAPVVHPNCRCDLELVYPDLGTDVVKAMPGDTWRGHGRSPNRNREGEFSHTEERVRNALAELDANKTRNALAALDQENVADALATLDRSAIRTDEALKTLDKVNVADALAALDAVQTRERRHVRIFEHNNGPAPDPSRPQGHDDSTAFVPLDDIITGILNIDPSRPPVRGQEIDIDAGIVGDDEAHGLKAFAMPNEFPGASSFDDDVDSMAFVSAFDTFMSSGGAAEAVGRNKQAAEEDAGRADELSDFKYISDRVDLESPQGQPSNTIVHDAAVAFSAKDKPFLTWLTNRILGSGDAAMGYASDELTSDSFMRTATANEIAMEMVWSVRNEQMVRRPDDPEPWREGIDMAKSYSSQNEDSADTERDVLAAEDSSAAEITPVFLRMHSWFGSDMGEVEGIDEPVRNAFVEGKYEVVNTEYIPLPDSIYRESIHAKDAAYVGRALVIDVAFVRPPRVE